MASPEALHPLSGLRVLDIGREVAGPVCGRLLARLGADVIRVESPGTGDPARRRGPFRAGAAHGESGPLHLYVNEGKRGVAIDLRTASGRDLFLNLVAKSDAVVENFEPRVLGKLDLAYATLAAARPEIVLTSISTFGDGGPYRDYRATELTVFAMGGHMYRSGDAARQPLRMGGWPSQYLVALHAAYATLVALRLAEERGVGQHVTLSIFESQVTAHAQAMVEVSYYAEETGACTPRGAMGLRGVRARDGMAMVTAQEQQMGRLAELVGAPPELGRVDPMNREGGRRALLEHVARWAEGHTKREVYELGQAMHIPASYPADPADLLASPQYRHRGFIESVDHPEAGRVAIPGIPFRWAGSTAPPRPAPRLGEHNAEVFGGLLGLSGAQLAQLAGAGVIA
ncbi:MAG: CoA transferase [Chloroflexi bacterium]|nr:CoA transferase [Chloroflexota bacterium]